MQALGCRRTSCLSTNNCCFRVLVAVSYRKLEWSTRFSSDCELFSQWIVIISDCCLMISYALHEFVISFLYTLQIVAMEHYSKRSCYFHFYWKYQRGLLSLITVYSHSRSKHNGESKREESQGCQLVEHSLAAAVHVVPKNYAPF